MNKEFRTFADTTDSSVTRWDSFGEIDGVGNVRVVRDFGDEPMTVTDKGKLVALYCPLCKGTWRK